MINASVVTVFPDLYTPFTSTSLIKRAHDNNIARVDVASLFDHVSPKERIDAPTFGHGAGMLLRPDVIERAVQSQEKKHGAAFKIFFSPQGKKLDQRLLEQIAHKVREKGHMMLLPARYEGMDARVEQEYADEVVSVGDFVLMGGDIPAMMLLEGVFRLIPGVVGKQESVEAESFAGPFVEAPEYTAPVVWHELQVPDVIRSGDHARIHAWQQEHAAKKTVMHHFNWMRSQPMTVAQKEIAQKYIPPHYVALLHSEVLVGKDRIPGSTSVTSIDLHDIARSACTYGVKNFFVVTALCDQRKIVEKILHFWQKGYGEQYNGNRHHAVNRVSVQDSLDQTIAAIEAKEGVKPLVIATSAREVPGVDWLSYYDQSLAWGHSKPVLFIFGTGQGLQDEVVARCDYLLAPLTGFSDFNHLSVRSAVAIILDKWLGINQKRQ